MATTMDKFPWIWRDLAKAGYLTSWCNADPYSAAFNWRMHGFKDAPTAEIGPCANIGLTVWLQRPLVARQRRQVQAFYFTACKVDRQSASKANRFQQYYHIRGKLLPKSLQGDELEQ
ncbi:hypothetical protein ElyMa_006762700 [Elysia marginata]|uniref:Uncharacterized protein n=1 Tax=Elysia marginata TaxID=1093978 RepID=A0AAV4IZE1_9GAST|nr:hypothetical protein ElyMa_006762700 [Elysia marginata]